MVLGRSIAVRLESLGLPVRQAIETAALLGAHGVQLDAVGELAPDRLSQTGRRQLRHLVRSHGLVFAALGFPSRHGFDSLERLEARMAQAAKTLALAHELGAPSVVAAIGKIPSSPEDPGTRHFFDAIDQVGREGERVGARLAIRTGADSPQRLAQFLAETNYYGLAVHYEPAHLMVQGHPVYEGVESLANSIVSVGIKDAIRSASSISGYIEVPMGQGEMDWGQFLGALAGIEFHGPVILERESSTQPVEDIKHAIEYLARFG